MREYDWVLAVPCDGVVVVGDVVEEERVWGVSRVAGEPLVEVEREPLCWAEDCVGGLEVK